MSNWLCRGAGCALVQIFLCLISTIAAMAGASDAGSWNGPPVTVNQIAIRVEDPYPRKVDWQRLARALIGFSAGDRLTPEQLSRAREDLAPFGKVRAEVIPAGKAARVVFVLEPYQRIQSIDISGAYPLFDKDVRTTMTLAPGDVFQPREMPEQEKLIVRRYRAEGYVDPRAHITWKQSPDDGHYHLQVTIDKGAYYVLDQVRLHGRHRLGETELLSRMTTWRKRTFGLGFGRFTAQEFDADIRKLTEFYRQKGFADVRITSHVSYDPQTHRVLGDVDIVEGPRYEIRFSGNRFYSAFRLRDNLVLFEKGNLGNIGLRRSIQNIRRRYLAAGFADVQVRWHQVSGSTADARQRVIMIVVEEGCRYHVADVSLRGNDTLNDEMLRQQILTRPPSFLHQGAYVKETLEEDLLSIGALYRSKGFPYARVSDQVDTDRANGRVRVIFHIQEGPRARVGQIVLEGRLPVPADQLTARIQSKSGDLFASYQVKRDEDTLSAILAQKGYPHVSVKSEVHMSTDRRRANLRFRIDTGPYVRVGQIFFLGVFRTRRPYLRREAGVSPGAPFSLQKVLEAQRGLRDLNIFESVQVRTVGLKEMAHTVHLLFQMREKRPYFIEAGGGYQTDKGAFLRLKSGDHNFLGTGKDLSVGAEVSEVGSRYEAGIAEPHLLGTRIGANAGFYYELSEPFNQDFGTETQGANLNFTRNWGASVKTVLANSFERRRQFLRGSGSTAQTQDPEAFDARSIFVTTPSVQYDSRDSFLQPRDGWLTSLAVDISKGLDNDLDDFLKYRFDARRFYPLLKRVTLAGRAWAGYLQTYGSGPPPQDQLFFLGGATTVRGYAENLLRYDADGNAVGGRLAVVASLEARIDVGWHFELIPFVDTGSVRQSLLDAGDDGFRWSVGAGLQYVTPIGPMGVFYGQKIDRRPGESSGQWHISIGYTF